MNETSKYITVEEKEKLFKLYKIAQNTPVIMMGGRDISMNVWDVVREYMDELAKKYGVETERSDGAKFSVTPDGKIVFVMT